MRKSDSALVRFLPLGAGRYFFSDVILVGILEDEFLVWKIQASV